MRTPNAILRGGPSDGRKLRADQCLSLTAEARTGEVSRYRVTKEKEGSFTVYRFAGIVEAKRR